jgi:hypothetical protein
MRSKDLRNKEGHARPKDDTGWLSGKGWCGVVRVTGQRQAAEKRKARRETDKMKEKEGKSRSY